MLAKYAENFMQITMSHWGYFFYGRTIWMFLGSKTQKNSQYLHIVTQIQGSQFPGVYLFPLKTENKEKPHQIAKYLRGILNQHIT